MPSPRGARARPGAGAPARVAALAALAAAVAAALLATPALLAAQDRCEVRASGESCAVEITVRRAPAAVLYLVLSTSSVVLSPAVGHGAARPETTAGPVASVFANVPWQLQLSAGQPFWRAPAGAARKPASDLLWATRPGGPFAPLSLQPATAAGGLAVHAAQVPLYFQARFDAATDAPGDYFLDVVLTLAAP